MHGISQWTDFSYMFSFWNEGSGKCVDATKMPFCLCLFPQSLKQTNLVVAILQQVKWEKMNCCTYNISFHRIQPTGSPVYLKRRTTKNVRISGVQTLLLLGSLKSEE